MKKNKPPKPPGAPGARPKKIPAEPASAISPRKRWLFRLLLLLALPIFLLGGAEITLRLLGYGYDPSFFKKIPVGGQDYFINNEKFSLRFFPPQLGRWPDPFIFSARKSPETIRIFIFGESAAMGDPQPAYGASRYLEVMLRKKFPAKKIEVINLGITAINSHVILPIARECARHDGDFWVIYMGNNEMVGPFGAATVFGAQAPPRALAQMNLAIQRTRLGQLLVNCLRSLGAKKQEASWGGMGMFLENQIAPDDSRKETVYRNFDANLRDIVQAGLGGGARVILNTVSVNLADCPPFASLGQAKLPAKQRQEFEEFFAQGKLWQSNRNFSVAAEAYKQVIDRAPQFAEAHFRLAECELALTNDAAAEQFQTACDLDALPFRADTRINKTIRQAAQNLHGDHLVLCDAEADLARSVPAKIAGDDIFFEHVHFNLEGNYRLGKLWAEAIAAKLKSNEPAVSADNWESQTDCDRALGLSIWNRHFILQSVIRRLNAPPLSTQFNNPQRLENIIQQDFALRQLQTASNAVLEVRHDFAAALQQAPADGYLYEGLANFLEAVGDPQAAAEAYRKLLELRPENFYASLQLGRLLGELGKPAEGQPLLEQVCHLRPSLPEGWSELGEVQAAQSKLEPALQSFKQAMRLRPTDATYISSAGQMLARLNQPVEAIKYFRRALELNPDSWPIHFELAGALVAANLADESVQEYRQVLKINPQHVTSHINLGVVLVRFNRLDEAIACFENALKLDPANQVAREYLNSVRQHQKQF